MLVLYPDVPRLLLDVVGLQLDLQDLQDLLGVSVDLATEGELHPELRARILAQAQTL
ncbi:MAG: hypothetical protein HYZ20_05310 [Burkholderiales bacterium]|nr:hypothetical protein [Burkholderiales bacterium]